MVGLGDLKRRAYLGPTALDNEIALIMANMAQVGRQAGRQEAERINLLGRGGSVCHTCVVTRWCIRTREREGEV